MWGWLLYKIVLKVKSLLFFINAGAGKNGSLPQHCRQCPPRQMVLLCPINEINCLFIWNLTLQFVTVIIYLSAEEKEFHAAKQFFGSVFDQYWLFLKSGSSPFLITIEFRRNKMYCWIVYKKKIELGTASLKVPVANWKISLLMTAVIHYGTYSESRPRIRIRNYCWGTSTMLTTNLPGLA